MGDENNYSTLQLALEQKAVLIKNKKGQYYKYINLKLKNKTFSMKLVSVGDVIKYEAYTLSGTTNSTLMGLPFTVVPNADNVSQISSTERVNNFVEPISNTEENTQSDTKINPVTDC